MSLRCPLIVMAKAPVAGFAKTRLMSALGAAGAAALAERLLLHALDQATGAARSGWIGTVDLCCTRMPPRALSQATLNAPLATGLPTTSPGPVPDIFHPTFVRAAAQPGVVLSVQGEGDLGQRMQAAFSRWLPAAHGVLMMGTDIPGLVSAVLERAAQALQDTDAVIVPALDGGYALIGLRRPAPALFEGMPWSTSAVLAITRQRLAAAGLRHTELQPLGDVDEPADLVLLPAGWLASPVPVAMPVPMPVAVKRAAPVPTPGPR